MHPTPEPPFAAVLHGVRVGLITTCTVGADGARGSFEPETARLARRLAAAAEARAGVEGGEPLDAALARAGIGLPDYEATLDGWSLLLDDGRSVRVALRLEADGTATWRW